jgi:hypothetical protein
MQDVNISVGRREFTGSVETAKPIILLLHWSMMTSTQWVFRQIDSTWKKSSVDYRFNYHSDEIEQPIADGLFSLKIQFDGGKTCEGWFILSHLTPSTSPKIQVYSQLKSGHLAANAGKTSMFL